MDYMMEFGLQADSPYIAEELQAELKAEVLPILVSCNFRYVGEDADEEMMAMEFLKALDMHNIQMPEVKRWRQFIDGTRKDLSIAHDGDYRAIAIRKGGNKK